MYACDASLLGHCIIFYISVVNKYSSYPADGITPHRNIVDRVNFMALPAVQEGIKCNVQKCKNYNTNVTLILTRDVKTVF